ncbi:MAG: 3-dehydroquinate synthase [Vicinamibacteria bacterium]
MIGLRVGLGGRGYRVHVGTGALRRLPALLRDLRGRRLVVVSSPRVWRRHGARLASGLERLGPFDRLLVPDGEARKSVAGLAGLWRGFARLRLPRDGVVLAFGGGVVGDLAGFAAASWQRGVDWVVVPTTLLAMVDSSVGGKTGINLPAGKNLVGAFHQPLAVVADTELLITLPRRQRQSGAYEVLKCGLIGDRGLFEALARQPAALLGAGGRAEERAIAAACRLKAAVVAKDEREGGLRRVLNLGHTVGHALETVTRYRRFTHGEAVGWGLLAAAAIAHGRGLISAGELARLATAVEGLGPRPAVRDLAATRVQQALSRDKKVKAGRLAFVLPKGLGRVVIRDDVTPLELRSALAAIGLPA